MPAPCSTARSRTSSPRDRRCQRRGHTRPLARVAGGREPARARVSQSRRQCPEVPGIAAAASACERDAARRRVAVQRRRQWHRYRAAVLRPHLCDLPAAARARGLSRHGHRPRDHQAHHRAPWRPHLGGVGARTWRDVLLHSAGGPGVAAMSPKSGAPGARIEILLVEDNPGDVRLTREALKDARVSNNLSVTMDGVEALAFLRKEGRYAASPRPDLILLDLNLPKKNGREVLEEIKKEDALRHIPVVILTTSQAAQDVVESYRLRPNAYVTKPVDLDQFLKVVGSIEQFWLEIVKLSRP